MNFIDRFTVVLDEAAEIVNSRDRDGRNAAVSVKDQFESTEFVLGLIKMKEARARSYLAAGNFPKFKEELQDIINYAAFCIVFEEEKQGAENERRLRDGVQNGESVTLTSEDTIGDEDTFEVSGPDAEGLSDLKMRGFALADIKAGELGDFAIRGHIFGNMGMFDGPLVEPLSVGDTTPAGGQSYREQERAHMSLEQRASLRLMEVLGINGSVSETAALLREANLTVVAR